MRLLDYFFLKKFRLLPKIKLKCLNAHTLCADFGLNAQSLGNSMILLKIMYRWQLSMDICICIASKPAYSKERIIPLLPRFMLSSKARPSAELFQRIILHAILQFANGMFSCEFPLTPAETQLQIWLSFQNEFQILWKQRQEKMFYSLFNIFWSSFWDGLKITFSIKVVFMFNTLTSKNFKLQS